MTRYEWRDARPEDVGKIMPMRVGETRDALTRANTEAAWEVSGAPGRWRRFGDGGAEWAFAQVYAPVEDDQTQEFDLNKPDGITLRDWFAGMAVQTLARALLTSYELDGDGIPAEEDGCGHRVENWYSISDDGTGEIYQSAAEHAYKLADAMLEARK